MPLKEEENNKEASLDDHFDSYTFIYLLRSWGRFKAIVAGRSIVNCSLYFILLSLGKHNLDKWNKKVLYFFLFLYWKSNQTFFPSYFSNEKKPYTKNTICTIGKEYLFCYETNLEFFKIIIFFWFGVIISKNFLI